MPRYALLASIASAGLLVACTPYQDIEQDGPPGDVAAPVMNDLAEPAATPAETENYGTDLEASPAEGGAGQIDSAVAVVYKIRTRDDIDPAVDAMMTLADEDDDGRISREEYSLLAPAFAQADNAVSSEAALPGTSEYSETSDAPLLSSDEFFDETAGSDGVISREDLRAAITARFDAADADGNGELTAEEAQTFAASFRFARE